MHNPAIDNFVQASLESEDKDLGLEWIPHWEIADITSSSMDNVYYASRLAHNDDNYDYDDERIWNEVYCIVGFH